MFFTSSPFVNRKDESGASVGRILIYRLSRDYQKPFLLFKKINSRGVTVLLTGHQSLLQ